MKNTTQSRDEKKSASASRNQVTEFLPNAAQAATNPAATNASTGASSASSKPANTQLATTQSTNAPSAPSANTQSTNAESSTNSAAHEASNTAPASSDELIRNLAYGKWEEAGCPMSDGVEFWLAAERDLNSKNDNNA